MKRSEINKSLKELEALCEKYHCYLPPFCHFSPEEWQDIGHEYDEVRDCMLGWDITDYGQNDFDKIAARLMKLPRFILRALIAVLRGLDYFGLMPKSLVKVSPFHGSVIITSMGSLGINAIYHHLYNFGNLPVFLSYGKMYAKTTVDENGVAERRHFVTFRAVVDERICDGYYYASAFKIMKRYLLHPELLDTEMTEFEEDID